MTLNTLYATVKSVFAAADLQKGDVVMIIIPFEYRSELMSETAIAMLATSPLMRDYVDFVPDHGDCGVVTYSGLGSVLVDFGIPDWEDISVHPQRLESLGPL